MSEVTTQPEPLAGRSETGGTGFTGWQNELPEDDGTADCAEPQIGEVEPGNAETGGQAPEPKLTVAAVARRLGVAPATLRTWDRRYGLGPSDHTSGRHRRYGSRDVARLELMQRALLRGASPAEAARFALSNPLPAEPADSGVLRPIAAGSTPVGADDAPDPSSPGGSEPVLISGVLGVHDAEAQDTATSETDGGAPALQDGNAQARGLDRAVLALDSWSAQQLLLESIDERGVLHTWQQVLRPVLLAVTERRQRFGSGEEVLHLLVECASTALRAALARAPQPLNPRPVLLGCVPGETRVLPLTVLAAELAARRIGQRLFGAALPQEGLVAAVRRAAPAVVVLWAHESTHAAPEMLTELPTPRQQVRLFAGGPGWNPSDLPPAIEHLPSLDSAVDRVGQVVLPR